MWGGLVWAAVVWAAVSVGPAKATAEPMAVHRWTWIGPPDEAKLRTTVGEMKRVAAEQPELVRVEATETSIVLTPMGDNPEDGMLVFPGRRDGMNFTHTAREAYDAVITRCLAAARVHFTPDELAISSVTADEIFGRRPGYRGAMRYSPFGMGVWALLYPLAIIFLFYFLFIRRGGGASWRSYYLFWFIAPMAISFFASYPLLLLAIPVALVARRWLPDPYLIFKHSGRMRSLETQVRANAANVTARRDLAMIWLERRRPLRALPLLEQALVEDPDSSELHFLHGVALVHARRWEEAVQPLIEACRLDSRLRYGEPYLRAADALMALRRWEDASEALGHFVKVNRSSVEGWYKLALVRRAQGDEKGAKGAFHEAKQAYRESPRFHRRRQLGWYLRALVRS
jgi:tetratricopeptide (TPR) repeat protein